MDTIPHGRVLTGCAMTSESIARPLGGRKAVQVWMACCPANDGCEPSLPTRHQVQDAAVRRPYAKARDPP